MAAFRPFNNEPDETPVYIIGSPMCGSPISVRIAPGRATGTFHRLVVNVIAYLKDKELDEMNIELSTVIDNSRISNADTIDFDISGALRTLFDGYRYTSEPPEQYPMVYFRLEARDEYINNGTLQTSNTAYLPELIPIEGEVPEGIPTITKDDHNFLVTFYRALNGKYTDLERLLAGYKKLAYDFSRKPKDSPQIVTVGEQFVYPNSFTGREATVPDASPSGSSATVTDASAPVPFLGYYFDDLPCGPTSEVTDIIYEGEQQIGDITVYALPEEYRNRDRYEFRFINSLGCMESYSLTCLSEEEMTVKTQNYTLAVNENFADFSHGVVQKSDDNETIKLTSGPLTPDWADWFAHEFLMAKYCWINLYPQTGTELWVRCHLYPGETLKLSNRKTNNPYDIPFTVRLDITGTLNTNITV